MGTGQTEINYKINQLDFQKAIREEMSDIVLKAFLSRFDNVLVGVKDIANMHQVSARTVTAYIKDGLIEPEIKVNENEHPKFRMSYALQKKLRARNK